MSYKKEVEKAFTKKMSLQTNNITKVLLVEDDASIAKPLTKLLQLRKCDVIWADSGSKALELIEKTPHPDCLLIDVMMPDMTGWELRSKIRESKDPELRNLPTIFLLADNQSQLDANARGESFVSKPIDLEVLFQTIRELTESSNNRSLH